MPREILGAAGLPFLLRLRRRRLWADIVSSKIDRCDGWCALLVSLVGIKDSQP